LIEGENNVGLIAERRAKTVPVASQRRRKARGIRRHAAAMPRPARRLYGRPVYTAEQLARMTADDLARIGLCLPPEPEWQAEWDEWERAQRAASRSEGRRAR
jgi:hypothetical protein